VEGSRWVGGKFFKNKKRKTCCTQVHKAKYSMNVEYPILGIPEIVWVPYHIFQQFEGYCIALQKPRNNAIPELGYTINTMG
jgi:hypothetical protein